MKVYCPPAVKEIKIFYGTMLNPVEGQTIFTYLDKIAHQLLAGTQNDEECVFTQINNYYPDYLGMATSQLRKIDFHLSDCRKCIACEYGFDSWQEVENLSECRFDLNFEKTVDSALSGHLQEVEKCLSANTYLIQSRSFFGHGATLLHYLAANGVELWRQQVPLNLAEMIKLLLDNGADLQAQMKVYGGSFTAYQLYCSSAHPSDAGLDDHVAQLLRP